MTGSGGRWMSMICWRWSASGRTASTLCATTSNMLTGATRKSILPVVMRPMSSRSSTSRESCTVWRSIMSRQDESVGESVGSVMRCNHPDRVAKRRERIAQFMRERGEKFAHCWLGQLQCASECACATLRSCVTLAKPRSVPVARRAKAVTTTFAQNMRAVLAHAPALILGARPKFTSRWRARARGLAGFDRSSDPGGRTPRSAGR